MGSMDVELSTRVRVVSVTTLVYPVDPKGILS